MSHPRGRSPAGSMHPRRRSPQAGRSGAVAVISVVITAGRFSACHCVNDDGMRDRSANEAVLNRRRAPQSLEQLKAIMALDREILGYAQTAQNELTAEYAHLMQGK